jgi:phenylalanyl-tRNA synthetase beta chain
VEGDVFAAEFLLSALRPGGRKPYVPLPRFPKVRRDVAFTFDRNIAAGNVENEIRMAGGELLVGVGVFDVYQGKGLPEGKKSLAFALELMSLERTLTDPEIDAVVGGIVRHIEQKFGAVLRGA